MNKLPPASADQPAEALAQLPGAKCSGAFYLLQAERDERETLYKASIGAGNSRGTTERLWKQWVVAKAKLCEATADA